MELIPAIISTGSTGSSTAATKDLRSERTPDASAMTASTETSTETSTEASTTHKDESSITAESDLSRPDRKIWVVTTAALPWRTGTSVNPLARALYLTRERPRHAVTLMVPFLPDAAEQRKVFGSNSPTFVSPEEQEEWIRTYCRERVACPDDAEAKLRIRFYNATYNGSFGSIFATVDICALIPDEEADVCILEEPEHMNWMRVVDEDKGESTSPSASPSTSTRTAEQEQEQPVDSSIEKKETLSRSEIAKLGWAVKFTHVVGIIHTNYDAYVRQYGMGAAFLAASALHALSALVTRAYCHKVIRLSDTLPSLDKTKEVTCNVHGVRQEFLEQPQPNQEHGDESLNAIYFIGKLIWAKGFDKMLDIEEMYKKRTGEYFPIDVYGSGPDERVIKRAFFGRKGILDATAKDEKAAPSPQLTPDRLAKGFFETAGSLRDQLLGKRDNNDEGNAELPPPPSPSIQEEEEEEEPPLEPIQVVWDKVTSSDGSNNDLQAAVSSETVPEMEFPNPFVILSDLSGSFMGYGSLTTMAGAKVGQDIVGLGVNALSSNGSTSGSSDDDEKDYSSESSREEETEEVIGTLASLSKVVEETGESPAAETTVPTSEENTSDSATPNPTETKEASQPTKQHKKHGRRRGPRFDPPKSRYELRRYPAPARFLGMKDHAVIRDLTQHKIFFNPSESEVLCTTSAEALAMGKFVILPKHPSNTFFEQFSNCLAYKSKEDCVEQIKWALANDPKPLSEEEHFQLTWEGANERLYKAAAMTKAEVKEWHDSGRAQGDKDAARIHYETVKRGRGVQKLLHRAS